MSHRTLIVTCDARDAVPFLLGLPTDEREQAKLIVTPHLAEALKERRMPSDVHVTAGVSTLEAIRHVVHDSQPVAIVIGPDPGNPFRCKGLVRARLLAPWALGRSARAGLIEIESGGVVSKAATALTRGALLRTIYIREGLQLAKYLRRGVIDRPGAFLRVGVLVPMTLITLARLLPFVAWTEARALLRARRS